MDLVHPPEPADWAPRAASGTLLPVTRPIPPAPVPPARWRRVAPVRRRVLAGVAAALTAVPVVAVLIATPVATAPGQRAAALTRPAAALTRPAAAVGMRACCNAPVPSSGPRWGSVPDRVAALPRSSTRGSPNGGGHPRR
jgi:hypothetical protein